MESESNQGVVRKGFSWGLVLGLALLGFSRSVGWALNKGAVLPAVVELYPVGVC